MQLLQIQRLAKCDQFVCKPTSERHGQKNLFNVVSFQLSFVDRLNTFSLSRTDSTLRCFFFLWHETSVEIKIIHFVPNVGIANFFIF